MRATGQSEGTANVNPFAVTVWLFVSVVPQAASIVVSNSSLAALRLGNERLANQGKDTRSMTKTKEKVSDAAGTVKPYVQRAISDEDLRDNVKAAFQAAREVYDELIGNRGVTTVATRVATDKEIQNRLKEAIDELREAADRVQGKKDHGGRNATLLIAGIALGLLFNPVTGPATRKWLSDVVFGADDDFTYQGGGNSTAG